MLAKLAYGVDATVPSQVGPTRSGADGTGAAVGAMGTRSAAQAPSVSANDTTTIARPLFFIATSIDYAPTNRKHDRREA
jgi:hypothetical protein